MPEPALELDLLGTRFSIEVPSARWSAFLTWLWLEFGAPAPPGAVRVRIAGNGAPWSLKLADRQPLPFEDPWDLAAVLRHWLVEQAVANADDVVPFHAAALTKDAAAVLLAGPSGAGKTTLALALADAGWALAGDDIAPVDPVSGLVHPFAKPLSIRAVRGMEDLPRPPDDWPPRRNGPLLVAAHSFPRQRQPFRPTALLFLDYDAGAAASHEAIPSARAAALSIEYVRRGGAKEVGALAGLCRSAAAARIRYPSSDVALKLIEAHLLISKEHLKPG